MIKPYPGPVKLVYAPQADIGSKLSQTGIKPSLEDILFEISKSFPSYVYWGFSKAPGGIDIVLIPISSHRKLLCY